MIVLKKIAFLRPLLAHASMLMRFSEEAKREQLSVSAQKAVWAASIIKTISQASLPVSLRDPTLRDVILSLPDPSKEFHFDKDAKNEVMKLFIEGIQLAQPFLKQARVQCAQQNVNPLLSQRKDGQAKNNKANGSFKKKFIFFPNRTVTTQVFQFLRTSSKNIFTSCLLTGGFGISKTVSIILFIHLSYHQTRFIYEASKDKQKKEEYDKLAKLELVPDKVMKYWYSPSSNILDYQIQNLILTQAVELQPAVLAKLKQSSAFYFKLRPFYKIPNLFERLILDPVNTNASQMRIPTKKLQQPEQQPQEVSPYRNTVILDKSFETFLLLGPHSTFNSQVLIERKTMEWSKQTLNKELVYSDGGLETMHIPYEKIVLTKAGQFDFWQTFWFEIERCANLEPTQLESAKETFYKSLQSRNQSDTQKLKTSTLSIFSRFVYIREFVATNYQKLMESIKSQNNQKVQEVIIDFHSFCLQEFKQKIQNFLQKGVKEHRQQILLKLYFKARSLKQNDQYRFSGFLLTTQHLESVLKMESLPHQWKDERKWIDNRRIKYEARIDLKSLLVFQTKQVVKFIFTLEEFTLIAEQIIVQSEFMYADLLKSLIKKDQETSSGSKKIDFELAVKRFLRDCLIEKGTLKFYAIQKPSKRTDKKFEIDQAVPFDQLNNISSAKQGCKQCAFEQNFQPAIQIALKNPGKDILAIPHVMVDGLRRRDDQSKSTVDFAILKYDSELNMFKIESFDVTFSRNLTQKMLQARKLFTKLFEGVTSIKGIPFSLTHTYLCPQDASYKQQEITNAPPLTIPLTILQANISFWFKPLFVQVHRQTPRTDNEREVIWRIAIGA